MAEDINIRIEKFLPIWGLYFFAVLMILVGLPLFFIDDSPERFLVIPSIPILFFAVAYQRGMRKNPVILKATKEGIHLPHRGFSLGWQEFIPWQNFIKIDEITEAGYLYTKLHSIAVFYSSSKSGKIRHYTLPYTVGKGQALNYPKGEVVKIITKAAQNG